VPSESLGEPVPQALAVAPLGRREQLGRQARRGALKLEPDGTPVFKREVERDKARERTVRLEQER
jgi:hypothetical protein